MIETAKELGYINVPENTFIDIDMIKIIQTNNW